MLLFHMASAHNKIAKSLAKRPTEFASIRANIITF